MVYKVLLAFMTFSKFLAQTLIHVHSKCIIHRPIKSGKHVAFYSNVQIIVTKIFTFKIDITWKDLYC
jgi:hypothetical protein